MLPKNSYPEPVTQPRSDMYRRIVMLTLIMMIIGMFGSVLIRFDNNDNSWAVRVNGQEISYKEFSNELARQSEYLTYFRAQYGHYADLLMQSMGWSSDPKVLALDRIIKNQLIDQYAKKLGIVVSTDYIRNCIGDASFAKQHLGHIIPNFAYTNDGLINMEVIRSYLKRQGMSVAEFEKKIESALIEKQLVDILVAMEYTPQFDIKQEFIARNLGKEFSYLEFSLESFVEKEKKNPITEQDLKDFYDSQNIQFRKYWVDERRDAAVWRFSPEKYDYQVSDEMIESYYENNKLKSYTLDPLKVEIKKIVVKTGDDLSAEEIRQSLINDPKSSWHKKWVSLKPFARDEKAGVIEKEAFLLLNEGDISPVLDTDQGPTIITLVRRIPRTYKSLESVKNDIKSILVTRAFKKSFIKDIKKAVEAGPDQLKAFIAQNGGKQEKVSGAERNDSVLAQKLFSLNKGEYSYLFDNQEGILMLMTHKSDRFLPEISSIKDIVTKDLYQHRARLALKDQIAKAQEMAQKSSFDDLAQILDAKLSHVPMVNPDDNNQIQLLEKKGLPIRSIMALEKVGAVLVQQGESNAFIVRVDSLQEFNQDKFLAAKNELEAQLGSARTKIFVDSFVASLHRNATIETNELIIIADEKYSK